MSACSNLPVIVLAAGQSSRMRGRDKLLEKIDGIPLLRRQAGIAKAATCGTVFVALPSPPHSRYAALEGMDVECVSIPDSVDGLSASLKGALSALPQDSPAVMLLLADLPELTVDDLKTVFASVDLQKEHLIWRGTTNAGDPGHPVVVKKDLFPEFRETTGDSGGGAVLKKHSKNTIFVSLPENRALCDLDTPEEWERWRANRSSKKA